MDQERVTKIWRWELSTKDIHIIILISILILEMLCISYMFGFGKIATIITLFGIAGSYLARNLVKKWILKHYVDLEVTSIALAAYLVPLLLFLLARILERLGYLSIPIFIAIGTLQSYFARLFKRTNFGWYLVSATFLLALQYVYGLLIISSDPIFFRIAPMLLVVLFPTIILSVYCADPSASPTAKTFYFILSLLSNAVLITLLIVKTIHTAMGGLY